MKKNLQRCAAIVLLFASLSGLKAQNSWSLLNCIDSNSYVYDLFSVNDTLFYSVDNNTLARSVNGGQSWTRIRNINTVYSEDYRYAYYQSTLFSVNTSDYTLTRYNGTTWLTDTVGFKGSKPLNLWAFNDRMFAFTNLGSNNFLYTRTTANAPWVVVNSFPTATDGSFKMVKQGSTYFGYSTSQGIIKSTDGTNFTAVSSTGLPNSAVHFISHGSCLFISVNSSSVAAAIFKSCDGGANWTKLSPFKYSASNPGSMFSDGTRLFLTEAIGVNPPDIYVSSNDGQSWADITDTAASTGMHYNISGFAKYKNVIIATQGDPDGGVRNCVKQYGTLSTGVNEQFDEANLGRVYPNPTSQYLMLEFTRKVVVKEIEILTLQGQKIMSVPMSDEFLASGVSVNVEQLPAGMYFVKVGNSLQKFVKQ